MISQALSQAHRWNLVNRNAAAAIVPPRLVIEKQRIWTATEAVAFLRGVSDDSYYALFYLALTAGLRRGELAALRWSDVDFNRKIMTVARNRTVAAGHGVIENSPKTKRGARPVHLSDEAVLSSIASAARRVTEPAT